MVEVVTVRVEEVAISLKMPMSRVELCGCVGVVSTLVCTVCRVSSVDTSLKGFQARYHIDCMK